MSPLQLTRGPMSVMSSPEMHFEDHRMLPFASLDKMPLRMHQSTPFQMKKNQQFPEEGALPTPVDHRHLASLLAHTLSDTFWRRTLDPHQITAIGYTHCSRRCDKAPQSFKWNNTILKINKLKRLWACNLNLQTTNARRLANDHQTNL